MMKVCTKCKIAKPATTEYFCYSSRQKSGLKPSCKECDKKYRENNKEYANRYQKEWYQKHRECVISKTKNYANAHKKDVSERQRKWREEHAKQLKAYHKEYYANHKDKAREYGKERRITHKEKLQEYAKAYYAAHKEKYYNQSRKYRENNKDKIRTINQLAYQKRKAKRKSVDATLTTEQWETIKKVFGNKCAYCGKTRRLEQDHLIALTKGGEYTHNNIVPACRSCNGSKNNKDYFEWYPQQPFYLKKRDQKILSFLNYKNGRQQLALIIKEGTWTSNSTK